MYGVDSDWSGGGRWMGGWNVQAARTLVQDCVVDKAWSGRTAHIRRLHGGGILHLANLDLTHSTRKSLVFCRSV